MPPDRLSRPTRYVRTAGLDDDIRRLGAVAATATEIKEAGCQSVHATLRDDGIEKILAG